MLLHHGHMVVSNKRVFRTKSIVFSCSKAALREVGTTIDSCTPIILSTLLAYAGLAVEQKWQKPQVVKGAQIEVYCGCFCKFFFFFNLTCGNIFLSSCQEMRKEQK